ncbi:MAG: DUF1127 domain-containing protein [Pseudomonadota bacterium]
MAAFDTIRESGDGHRFGGLSTIYNRVLGVFLYWNDMRATRKALSALSDRELEDIGLARGDIYEITGA